MGKLLTFYFLFSLSKIIFLKAGKYKIYNKNETELLAGLAIFTSTISEEKNYNAYSNLQNISKFTILFFSFLIFNRKK